MQGAPEKGTTAILQFLRIYIMFIYEIFHSKVYLYVLIDIQGGPKTGPFLKVYDSCV